MTRFDDYARGLARLSGNPFQAEVVRALQGERTRVAEPPEKLDLPALQPERDVDQDQSADQAPAALIAALRQVMRRAPSEQ